MKKVVMLGRIKDNSNTDMSGKALLFALMVVDVVSGGSGGGGGATACG